MALKMGVAPAGLHVSSAAGKPAAAKAAAAAARDGTRTCRHPRERPGQLQPSFQLLPTVPNPSPLAACARTLTRAKEGPLVHGGAVVMVHAAQPPAARHSLPGAVAVRAAAAAADAAADAALTGRGVYAADVDATLLEHHLPGLGFPEHGGTAGRGGVGRRRGRRWLRLGVDALGARQQLQAGAAAVRRSARRHGSGQGLGARLQLQLQRPRARGLGLEAASARRGRHSIGLGAHFHQQGAAASAAVAAGIHRHQRAGAGIGSGADAFACGVGAVRAPTSRRRAAQGRPGGAAELAVQV